MEHVYVFPVVGLILGLVIAAAAFLAAQALSANLIAIVVIVAIYKLCGINHIDGLADFGDGVIAHGPLENKVKAMKDVNTGTGGVVFMVVLLLATYACVSAMPAKLLPLALVAAEVSAKQSMIGFAANSRPLQKGFGQIMIEKTGKREFFIGLVISAVVCSAVLGFLGLAMLTVSQVSALYMVQVAKTNFGGATGDGIGASNEVARVAALASAVALGGVLSWTLW